MLVILSPTNDWYLWVWKPPPDSLVCTGPFPPCPRLLVSISVQCLSQHLGFTNTQGQQVTVKGPLFIETFAVFHHEALSARLPQGDISSIHAFQLRAGTCCSAFLLVIQLRVGDEELMGFQADVFLIASLLVGKRHVSLEEMIQTTLGAIPHPL